MSSSIEMTITQTHSVNRSMDHHFTKCHPKFQTKHIFKCKNVHVCVHPHIHILIHLAKNIGHMNGVNI